MKLLALNALFTLFFLLPEFSQAGLLIDFDYGIVQDSMITATTVSSQKTIMDIGGFVNVDNKASFYLGAGLVNLSSSDVGTATVAYTTQDLFLGAKWYVDRDRTFSVTGGYALNAAGSYVSGSTTETLSGTSMLFKFSASRQIKKMSIGVALIYYVGSYTTKIVSNTTSSISYSKTYMVPAISANYAF